MDQDLTILSPEKTILTYRLAGLGSRIGAHFLDLVLVGAVTFGFSWLCAAVGSLLDSQLATGFVLFMSFVLPFAYFILLEGMLNGQTIGKKAFGIRVRMADGTPVNFLAALGRNLMRPADMLPGPYFVGFLAIFTNAKSQRLGDLVSNTVVCHEHRPQPFTVAPHTVGIHPLENFVGELRGMTQEEYYALRRFCDRFPELPGPTQDRMTDDLWAPIARRRNVPALPNVHPIYLAEAVVMKYGRQHGLL
ncbi:MAG: RDD family protein [Fimbriimonas sp.]|nr:RDD family protein [Fimbriimonas sp.]